MLKSFPLAAGLHGNWFSWCTRVTKPNMLHTYYRPQRSCGQGNIFAPVCHSVHRGGVSAGMPHPLKSRHPRNRHPPRADTPQEQTRPESRHTLLLEQTPPRADTPPEQTPPKSRHPPPPRVADSSIRSMSGRYASYWNAFLFFIFLLITIVYSLRFRLDYFTFSIGQIDI